MRANEMTRPSTRPAIDEPMMAAIITAGLLAGRSTQLSAPATPVSASSMTVRTTTSSMVIIRDGTAGGA